MNDITKRFISVYEHLRAENKVSGKSDFAEKIDISSSMMNEITKDRSGVGVSALQNTVLVFNQINAKWLMTGRGNMIYNEYDLPNSNIVSEPEVLYGVKSIPLLPLTAFAGRGLGAFNDLKIERKYQIHEFQNADFLIAVKGNSMYPKYSSGDILACALVKDRLFFQWNKPHVIYTESQGVLVKRVRKSELEAHVLCVSDNIQYDPFDVPTTDIVDIAIIIGAIRLE